MGTTEYTEITEEGNRIQIFSVISVYSVVS